MHVNCYSNSSELLNPFTKNAFFIQFSMQQLKNFVQSSHLGYTECYRAKKLVGENFQIAFLLVSADYGHVQ